MRDFFIMSFLHHVNRNGGQSFGYANTVKDAGVEKFSLVYGPKEKYFDVFDNLSYFWEDICRALSYFHALTGCDTKSSFY